MLHIANINQIFFELFEEQPFVETELDYSFSNYKNWPTSAIR